MTPVAMIGEADYYANEMARDPNAPDFLPTT